MTLTQEKKPFIYSLGIHGAILLVLVVRPYFTSTVKPFEKSVKVDVISMPEKNQKIIKKIEAPTEAKKPMEQKEKEVTKKAEEPKKKATAAPKVEPKKTIVEKSKPVEPKVEEVKISEQDAFKKLEALKAQKEEEEALKNFAQKENEIKGNRVSKGSSLVGVEKLEYTNYKEILHGAVSADWQLPQWLLESDLKAVVEIKIDSDGNLVYKNLVQSSGNKIYDEKVMEAILSAAPFDPPPEKFKGVVLYEGVTLTFP